MAVLRVASYLVLRRGERVRLPCPVYASVCQTLPCATVATETAAASSAGFFLRAFGAERPNSPAAGSRSEARAEAGGGQVQCLVRLGGLRQATRRAPPPIDTVPWLCSPMPLPRPDVLRMPT